jgi:hypothetical protein
MDRSNAPLSHPQISGHSTPREPGWLQVFFLLLVSAYATLLIRFPNPFFADDSFFYLQVGRNFALGYGSTFNRLMPTNGYHPVWMLLCALIYKVFPGRDAGLHAVAALIVLLNLATLLLVQRLLHRLGTEAWVAWTVLLPFLFGLQLGTESAISAAVLAAMLLALRRVFEQPSRAAIFCFHASAAFSVLCRLDSIFVIASLWIAALVGSAQLADRRLLRWQLQCIPLYAILWGSYLLSNLVWFHNIVPISGLLKSSTPWHHRFGHNLPHTALLALLIASLALCILWRKQRDRWLLYVELPFFAGVLLHAAYITLRMTSETRWTWYYTSWALLAALTAARATTCLLRSCRAERLRSILLASALLASLALFQHYGWKHSRLQTLPLPATILQHAVEQQDHIQRLLVYDQPGAMAYYSHMSVVPVDGLMGNLDFQKELDQQGLQEFLSREKIQAFVGPPVPFDDWGRRTYCDQVFLESTRFTCAPLGNGLWTITGVEVYARRPFRPAGYLPLPAAQMIWDQPNYVAVWRIQQP